MAWPPPLTRVVRRIVTNETELPPDCSRYRNPHELPTERHVTHERRAYAAQRLGRCAASGQAFGAAQDLLSSQPGWANRPLDASARCDRPAGATLGLGAGDGS